MLPLLGLGYTKYGNAVVRAQAHWINHVNQVASSPTLPISVRNILLHTRSNNQDQVHAIPFVKQLGSQLMTVSYGSSIPAVCLTTNQAANEAQHIAKAPHLAANTIMANAQLFKGRLNSLVDFITHHNAI